MAKGKEDGDFLTSKGSNHLQRRYMHWGRIVEDVLDLPAHRDVVISKCWIVHPTAVGFRRSIGEPKGQIADYRFALHDGRGIHVREYGDHYRVHWDMVDPSVSIVTHLKRDAPHIYMLLLGVLGVSAGALLGGILSRLMRRV
ncbi:MAG: hypothetical protein RMJ59_05135 [Candidatus Nitrosocaldus sp.]|nr:hypothetical protein [Candidatus Nitrosocaldus sp.]MCS7141894.1 hypothetical protein [Candidatus Nitrosocaldus sp.]MDW8000853.1 hypothetical protein [Candidatus Nitrosocaldus sp.]MDW8275747.1 hypothetical protein [Candidatus Nitrosocaldus sp.]